MHNRPVTDSVFEPPARRDAVTFDMFLLDDDFDRTFFESAEASEVKEHRYEF